MKNSHIEIGTGSDRLEMLGYDILALISIGKTESINSILQHFAEGNIMIYLKEKYNDNLFIISDTCPYNTDDWDKIFSEYSYMSFGHDIRRKMGLLNEEKDGLLLLLNIILDEVSKRKYA